MDNERDGERVKIVSMASYAHEMKRQGEPLPKSLNGRMQRWPAQKLPCHERLDEAKRLFEGWDAKDDDGER